MDTFCLTIAYDGTDYFGWQKTHEGPSIQQTLEDALEQILQTPTPVEGASRTDRGVHAMEQIATFQATRSLPYQKALNSKLPRSIRIISSQRVRDTFHPTLDALEKTYLYKISQHPFLSPFDRRDTWHVPQVIDEEKMEQAKNVVLGTHNFRAFCNQRKNLSYTHYIRTVHDIQISRKNHLILIEITADAFVYKMCRNLVGFIIYAGLGKLRDTPENILKNQDRRAYYITAPAHGLCLQKIRYRDLQNA